MRSLIAAARIWAYPHPCDLRRGFDGLSGLAAGLSLELRGGDACLFVNRSRSRSKVIFHDGSGLCVLHKRLDKGRFAPLWRCDDEGRTLLSPAELMLYLEGCVEVGYRPLSPLSASS